MTSPESNVILIVDDNLTNREMLSSILADAGFETVVAPSGESALKQLTYERPSLILLDVMMRGINGFETCQHIKQDPQTCDIPIIFTTALTDTADKVKGLNMGAVDYILKPFQSDEVLARVRLHLKLHSLTKTLEQQNEQLKQLTEDLEQRVTERTQELTRSLENLQQAQLQLVQSEKMSALGQLVAGVAHEINNPLNSTLGNLKHADRYMRDLITHIRLYQQDYPEPTTQIQDHAEAIDLEFSIEDLSKLMVSMRIGAERIKEISTSLRTFSRADSDQKVDFNIHEGIESTLLLLKHQLNASHRPAIKVVRDYGDLPPVRCYPGQLNQVFMNLLVNAIDAIEERDQQRSIDAMSVEPSVIHIRTEVWFSENQVRVHITDNAGGIPAEVQQRVFDHSFTTKAVGKGTGLGLSISQQIVESKHGGRLSFVSDVGQGTEFSIAIPLR